MAFAWRRQPARKGGNWINRLASKGMQVTATIGGKHPADELTRPPANPDDAARV